MVVGVDSVGVGVDSIIRIPINESFYGSSPNFHLTESPVVKPASGRISRKYGAPCYPDVIVRRFFANKLCKNFFFVISSFVVSSSHETLVQEYHWVGGGTIVEFVQCTVWSSVDDVGVGVGVACG